MTMKRRHSRRRLATAVPVARAAAGLAFAQTAKEIELEARVAQLEAQIQSLLQAQQQQQESLSQTRTRLDEVQVAQAPKPVQSKPILANPDAVFTYGGFIKLDAMATDTSDGMIAEGSAGRMFYVPSTIPVAPQRGCVQGSQVRIDGVLVARRLRWDRQGRALPAWQACRRLVGDELFLLSSSNPASFDSRYFVPVSVDAVIGRAQPLWLEARR